jgi:hypothetical protein
MFGTRGEARQKEQRRIVGTAKELRSLLVHVPILLRPTYYTECSGFNEFTELGARNCQTTVASFQPLRALALSFVLFGLVI